MTSIFSSEDIFTAGWNSHYDYLHNDNIPDNARDAYTAFRYKQLKDNEGLDSANEFAKSRANTSKPENLKCPDCDGEMVSRKSIHGIFWGCKGYPKCKGTRNSDGSSKSEMRRLAQENSGHGDYEDIGPDPLTTKHIKFGESYSFKKS